jgi:hypothetical protein
MLDGNGESCPPTQGHKLGKKKISGNIVGTGGTQPRRGETQEHAWAALSEREYRTWPGKEIVCKKVHSLEGIKRATS